MNQKTIVYGVLALVVLACGTTEDTVPATDAATDAAVDTVVELDAVTVSDEGTIADVDRPMDVPTVPDTTPAEDVATVEETLDIADAAPQVDTEPSSDAVSLDDAGAVSDSESEQDVEMPADTAEKVDAAAADAAVALDCDDSIIAFPVDNPGMFEFYELCIPKGDDSLVGQLQSIDSTLYCGIGGIFAQCAKSGLNGCHGDLMFEPGTKVIAAEKWAELCALSLVDGVSVIAGGHWL